MFDIGFFELALIALVLLVVMGPEKLPEVARQGAFMVRKLRTWLTDMKSEMNAQDSEGMASLKQATREIADLKASISQMGQDVMTEVESAGEEVQNSVAEVEDELLELDNQSYFEALINEDVEPQLLADEVAGKPEEKPSKKKSSSTSRSKAVNKKPAAAKRKKATTNKKAITNKKVTASSKAKAKPAKPKAKTNAKKKDAE